MNCCASNVLNPSFYQKYVSTFTVHPNKLLQNWKILAYWPEFLSRFAFKNKSMPNKIFKWKINRTSMLVTSSSNWASVYRLLFFFSYHIVGHWLNNMFRNYFACLGTVINMPFPNWLHHIIMCMCIDCTFHWIRVHFEETFEYYQNYW